MEFNKDKWYVVSGQAGTYFAKIKNAKKDELELTDARLLYYWTGNSLNQVATDGLIKGGKVSVSCELTVFGVLRVLCCTDKAIESIMGTEVWKQ